MLNKAKFLVPVLAGMFLMQSCQDKVKKGEFTQGEGSLEYMIFSKGKDGKYEPKENPALDTTIIGQVLTMQQVVKNDKDSVLFSTYTSKQPAMALMNAAPYKGSLEGALLMLKPGDSAVFKISADTLFTKSYQQPLPPFIKKGSKLTFHIVAEKLQSKEQAMAEQQKMQEEKMKEMQAHAEKQIAVDDENIQKYLKEQNLTAQKTPSGLYYIITQKGTGPTPKPGQIVAVNYRGTTFDGKEFDSSAKTGVPFEFQIGQGMVIRGWDEGIALLNKGAKATLLIPSTLAYGQQGAGANIPADASLRFEVELVDIK
ncbi:FKBP-type peptidyl-prolyl cis-trans isomerase [Adhaeribacter terreus]|uniref:Peptidyl-prolyl cis-trans isomerase n=1 Tax=Adhaeribacter terreus TaxID=529703 RepID=A0ABW0EBP6_9BACT